MPSLARMLGLMLVLAGPLVLAAQTVPSAGPWTGPSAVRPSVPYAARPYRPTAALPLARSVRTDPHAGRVVPAEYQTSAQSFDQSPRPIEPASPAEAISSGSLSPGSSLMGSSLPGSSLPGSSPSGPITLSPPRKFPPVRLSKPGQSGNSNSKAPGGLPSVVTAGGSLAMVLGVFFLTAWAMRRARPAGMSMLPGEVFEVLGRAPMANRQQVHLLRCGSKLLLVCVTPTGTETLTEIVDPIEVDRLAGLCRQTHSGSTTEAFRQVLGQFAPQQPDSGSLTRLFGGRKQPRDVQRSPSDVETRNV